MRAVSLALVLVFLFSEVASATTCELLDGAYVEASDGTYLGFFGSASALESIANPAGIYGSSAGVNSVFNPAGLYGSTAGVNSANNSSAVNPPSIYSGLTFVGYLSTNSTKTPKVEAQATVENCTFTTTEPKRIGGEGFFALGLDSSTTVSFFGNSKTGFKMEPTSAGTLNLKILKHLNNLLYHDLLLIFFCSYHVIYNFIFAQPRDLRILNLIDL